MNHVLISSQRQQLNAPRNNNINALGQVFCRNSAAVTAGLLVIAGVLPTARCWGRGFGPSAARVLIVIGALFIMGGGNLVLLVAGAAFRNGSLAPLRSPTLLIGTVSLIASALHLGRHYARLGMGGTERVAVFALEVWMVIVAVHILRILRDTAIRNPNW